MRRKHHKAFWALRLHVVFPRIVNGDIKMWPIIQSGTRNGFIIKMESKRTHQMQRDTQTDTQSSDSSGIMGNFRANKDY